LKEKTNGHVESIFDFLRFFSNLKEVKEEVERGDKKYKIYQTISDYMEIVKEYIKNNEYYKRMSTEVINEAVEEIENYITQRLNIR
jgi:hypothetical protein